MNTATTGHAQYSHLEQALYVAFELSSRTWKLGMTVGFGQKARERNVDAGDLTCLAEEIRLAKKHFGLSPSTPVYSCYEAGRDGFWIQAEWFPRRKRHELRVLYRRHELHQRAAEARGERQGP